MKESVNPHPAQPYFFLLESTWSFQMFGNKLLHKVPDWVIQSCLRIEMTLFYTHTIIAGFKNAIVLRKYSGSL